MALVVKREKYKGKGYIPIFLLHVIPLLAFFALVLALIIGMGGTFSEEVYIRYYKSFLPFTVIIPILIALSTAFSYRRALIIVTPAECVNIDKLYEFFYRQDYMLDTRKKNSNPNRKVFKRVGFMRRTLCLNFDKPSVEVTPTEVRVVMLKRLSVSLLSQFSYRKNFELSESRTNG